MKVERPSPPLSFVKAEFQCPIIVNNAGIIIKWSFIPIFFEKYIEIKPLVASRKKTITPKGLFTSLHTLVAPACLVPK